MTVEITIEQLSAAAEHRGGVDARRADGAFFTSSDVADWLARRSIGARLLTAAGLPLTTIERLLADGVDLRDEIRRVLLDDASTLADVRGMLAALRVLDPTCGAGVFLAAAWRELTELQVLIDSLAGDASHPRISPHQLTGVDIDSNAVASTASVLERMGARGAYVVHGDALELNLTELGAFDIVLGNPPYVRASPNDAPAGTRSAAAGNRAAWIVERALGACAPNACIAMVLPISAASTPVWGSFRNVWVSACASTHTAHFDAIPSALFADAVQRVSIYEGRLRITSNDGGVSVVGSWFTTRYHRWLRRERDGLLQRIRHVPLSCDRSTQLPVPKVGSGVERELLARIDTFPKLGRWFVSNAAASSTDNVMFYKRRWSYFLLFANFVPPIWDADGAPREPSELQTIAICADIPAALVIALCSSTLFWWWFSALTDNRNVNRGELRAFGVPDLTATQLSELTALGHELMLELRACGEVRECTYRSIGTIYNTYYRQAATRPVLDRIDTALATVYGMNARELETILAYEQRFRS